MRRFFERMKEKAGFTLTELIVVVAILGVLAAIATPSIIGYIDDAKTNSDEANKQNIINSYKRLYAKGDITATSDKDDTSDAIEAELGSALYPKTGTTGQYFILTTATITVGIANTADADATVRIGAAAP